MFHKFPSSRNPLYGFIEYWQHLVAYMFFSSILLPFHIIKSKYCYNISIRKGGNVMSKSKLSLRLQELRTFHGYTQKYVAAYLGMSRQGYAHYELDKNTPHYKTLKKLANLYSISIDELIDITDDAVLESKNYHIGTHKGSDSHTSISGTEVKLLSDYRNLTSKGQQEMLEFMNYLKYKYSAK